MFWSLTLIDTPPINLLCCTCSSLWSLESLSSDWDFNSWDFLRYSFWSCSLAFLIASVVISSANVFNADLIRTKRLSWRCLQKGSRTYCYIHDNQVQFYIRGTLAWYLLSCQKISWSEFVKKVYADQIMKQINPDFRQSWFSVVRIFPVADQTSKQFSECELRSIENFSATVKWNNRLKIGNFSVSYARSPSLDR